jgi:hypothetical protein
VESPGLSRIREEVAAVNLPAQQPIGEDLDEGRTARVTLAHTMRVETGDQVTDGAATHLAPGAESMLWQWSLKQRDNGKPSAETLSRFDRVWEAFIAGETRPRVDAQPERKRRTKTRPSYPMSIPRGSIDR